ncbi:zinc finger MYM-type protein 2-like [Rhizophagus clarus]|uniref:Zinc finger MYM-type protein 2-like n=3 Tax=Rhizophagus clarus TaxID=94130 RepID=A0A8H3QJ54_9GLOM|nr:zinc finger MYM-type protein 2-like [Rhizophagus clarus]
MSIPTHEEIYRLQQLSRVKNTDKCTSKWLRVVDRFNKEANMTKKINQYDTCNELEDFLCKFITWLKKLNGEEYKAESIYNCYASLARYLKEESVIKPCKIWDQYSFPLAIKTLDGKMKQLQLQRLGETAQADSLTRQETQQILDHSTMNGEDNESLIRRVFFWISLLCDGGLNLEMFIEKNNQRGVRNRNKYGKSTSRKIPIPPDFEGNNYRPIYDILKYKSMRPSEACPSFFLETTRSKADINKGIWYKKNRMGQNKLGQMLHQIATLTGIDLSDGRKIVNHSCRRTAIQMLKDGDVPEDDIMEFSGHRSREGVRTYKSPDEARKIKNVVSLIPLDLDDIEIEEFEYFPGNWENLNINDSDSDAPDNDGLDEDVYNSSSSEVDSEENSDYYNTDNVDDNDKLIKKRKALKEIDNSNITQKKKKSEAQLEFSKIIIPNTVKDVHFHIHY